MSYLVTNISGSMIRIEDKGKTIFLGPGNSCTTVRKFDSNYLMECIEVTSDKDGEKLEKKEDKKVKLKGGRMNNGTTTRHVV